MKHIKSIVNFLDIKSEDYDGSEKVRSINEIICKPVDNADSLVELFKGLRQDEIDVVMGLVNRMKFAKMESSSSSSSLDEMKLPSFRTTELI